MLGVAGESLPSLAVLGGADGIGDLLLLLRDGRVLGKAVVVLLLEVSGIHEVRDVTSRSSLGRAATAARLAAGARLRLGAMGVA